jgi:hypothetical protein
METVKSDVDPARVVTVQVGTIYKYRNRKALADENDARKIQGKPPIKIDKEPERTRIRLLEVDRRDSTIPTRYWFDDLDQQKVYPLIAWQVVLYVET